MIVRTHEPEKRIVESRFLQTEKYRIGPVECAQATLGKAPFRFAVRFGTGRHTEGERGSTAFFEDSKNVAGITKVEPRQRLDHWQNTVKPGVLGTNRGVIDQLERGAINSVGLTKPVILLRIPGIII